MKQKHVITLSVLMGSASLLPALAQQNDYYSRNKYTAVTERAQPEFDPEPVRVGSGVFNAALTLGVVANDNVLATNTDEESDTIGTVDATLRGRTDWSNHQLNGRLSVGHNEYFDLDNESNSYIAGAVGGRLDVTREVSLTGEVFGEDRAEARNNIANQGGLDGPIEYTRYGARAGVNYVNDRIQVNATGQVATADYEDGTLLVGGTNVDQDFRDNTQTTGRVRVGYAVTPNVAVFGQGIVSSRDYDNPSFVSGANRNRDADSYALQAGVDFELNVLLRGEVAVGYVSEDRKDDFYQDTDGVSVDARVQWFPTELTTVTFNAGRTVDDQGIIDAGSSVVTRGGVRVDHELRRNIIIGARAQFADYEYEGQDASNEESELEAFATYKLNKRARVRGFILRRERDGSGAGFATTNGYEQNILGVSLTLYP